MKLDRRSFVKLLASAVTTGMRQGELLGLHWGDVDLRGGTIAVRRQLLDHGMGRPELGDLKTAKSRRSVTLPAVAALARHRERLGALPLPSAPVFTDTRGGPLRKRNLLRRWSHPLVARAGLPRMRFHDLRHAHASLLLAAGVHPKVVQERLGHSQVSVTLDTYSHVAPSLQRDAAVRVDESLANRSRLGGGEAELRPECSDGSCGC